MLRNGIKERRISETYKALLQCSKICIFTCLSILHFSCLRQRKKPFKRLLRSYTWMHRIFLYYYADGAGKGFNYLKNSPEAKTLATGRTAAVNRGESPLGIGKAFKILTIHTTGGSYETATHKKTR
jgi:hypothetical protein